MHDVCPGGGTVCIILTDTYDDNGNLVGTVGETWGCDGSYYNWKWPP